MTERRADEAADRKRDHGDFPAQIALLYESKDGKLCLFEDAAGHLTAVRAANLA